MASMPMVRPLPRTAVRLVLLAMFIAGQVLLLNDRRKKHRAHAGINRARMEKPVGLPAYK